MGQFLIAGNELGVNEVSSAIGWVRSKGAWTDQQVWDWGVEGGILFTDPSRSDTECATLYADFTPSRNYAEPLSTDLSVHVQHLRDYFNADPAAITNAQTVHVVKDLIRAIKYLNDQIA